MQNFIAIHFNDIGLPEQEMLIAGLSEAGYEAFEQTGNAFVAFIPEKSFNEKHLRDASVSLCNSYRKEVIAEKNWNALWESSFEPVHVGTFCTIRAAFHPPQQKAKHEVIITPKMSFGTGHHATTFLMVSMMEHLDLKNKSVLDFGTGTGVLAILAEKCGAGSITAIDIDEWSINNAQENISSNACTSIQLELSGSLSDKKKFDVILANINKAVLDTELPQMVQHLEPGGVLVLSGILKTDLRSIKDQVVSLGLNSFKVVEQLEWIAVKCSKQSAI
ncbi:MAG TPA: 50S ribosomal protein L11 methyltransferase [Flavitalea sp.]|nr:50S ribosomal protein L11 methyltransferase [Flavitalea sp.]